MALGTLNRWKTLGLVAAILAFAAALQLFNANPAASQALYLTAYQAPSDPGIDPNSAVWKTVPPIRVPLTAQPGVYAAGGGSVPFVNAQALHFNNQVYIRVQWDDATADESTRRAQDFADAVAVEFPSKAAATVPSICMGQADSGVNIWHWRADSQAGGPAPDNLYDGMVSDGSPEVFYTARMVGNPYANPDAGSVQTLISQTFGTLSPAAAQQVLGQGTRVANGWAVVFSRGYTGADTQQATFAPGTNTDMAFAVWNGSDGDRNGRKSASQFVTLALAGAPLPADGGTNMTAVFLAMGLVGAFLALGLGFGAYGYLEGRDKK